MKKHKLLLIVPLLFMIAIAFAKQDPVKKATVTPTVKKENKTLTDEEIKKEKLSKSTYGSADQKSGLPYTSGPVDGPTQPKKDVITPVVDAATPK